jgi:hypothetical protein
VIPHPSAIPPSNRPFFEIARKQEKFKQKLRIDEIFGITIYTATVKI